MSTPNPTVQERIAKLRATFIEQLPERIAQARDLLSRLRDAPGDPATLEEIHRFFHSLKGTGRSFGLQKLGVAASQAESWTASRIDSPVESITPEWLEQLERYLDLLASMADRVDAENGGRPEPARKIQKEYNEVYGMDRRGRLVYLCDDDVLTLDQLASQLRCFGFKTMTFTDPNTLHAAVMNRKPDVVIMDIMFPQGHEAGTDAIYALNQEIGCNLATIFLSARGDFAARLGAVRAGGEAYFLKPVRALELVSALDAMTSPQQSDPFRILVVDDEPQVAEYHALILEGAGMVTRSLTDPSRILDELREFRSDLVLMDMYMPSCHGQDLARLIRQMPDHVGLPIVFLSGETDRKKQDTAMRIGAEGFLTKPVNPDDLVTAVAVRAERMRALRSLMTRDSLTGLFNHTTTTQLLESAIASFQRGGGTLCFTMIDIDRFKSVNDTHGHPVGDQVIMALARVLHQRLRNSDVVGRYGGEEFAVILQDTTLDRAARLINELRLDFGRVQFYSPKGTFSCTFSAGIASVARHASLESLREAADRALYLAKNNGRNRVVLDG
ncbi:MAG: diguanylate cyclase [Magnetococcales bacterium]|nr:diguanylate cyclase [Magnetococcales bacterium]